MAELQIQLTEIRTPSAIDVHRRVGIAHRSCRAALHLRGPGRNAETGRRFLPRCFSGPADPFLLPPAAWMMRGRPEAVARFPRFAGEVIAARETGSFGQPPRWDRERTADNVHSRCIRA